MRVMPPFSGCNSGLVPSRCRNLLPPKRVWRCWTAWCHILRDL